MSLRKPPTVRLHCPECGWIEPDTSDGTIVNCHKFFETPHRRAQLAPYAESFRRAKDLNKVSEEDLKRLRSA